MSLTIGEVARRSGCSVSTIRYYEQIGLIAAAARGDNGRRVYGWPDVSRLTFIRRARDFGMSIDQVRDLLAATASPASACASAKSIVTARLDDVKRRRAELARLETALRTMLARCETTCEPASDCCTIFADIEQAGTTALNPQRAVIASSV